MHQPPLLPVSAFEEEFHAFALQEAVTPAPRGAILLYGSSSIRLWETLADDFPGLSIVNRGFGGSTLADCVQEFERLVVPLEPRAIVLYAGDNDLDQGAAPEKVDALFHEFARLVSERLGAIPLVFISIKASPSRVCNLDNIRKANSLVRATIANLPNAYYLDLFSLMLDFAGGPRRELFTEDCLHLSREGYRLWTRELREAFEDLSLLG